MIELIIYTLIGLFFSIIIGVFIIFIIKEDDFLEELIVFSIFNTFTWPITVPLLFLSLLFYFIYKSVINCIRYPYPSLSNLSLTHQIPKTLHFPSTHPKLFLEHSFLTLSFNSINNIFYHLIFNLEIKA